MEWVFAAYLPETWNRSDPYLFPLQGNLTDLPPAIIYTAEYDVLRDEGAAYAQKLRDAGVPVEFVNAEDQMHGFAMHTRTNTRAAELVQQASDRLKKALHS
jgi:acetyl esterase/lipase